LLKNPVLYQGIALAMPQVLQHQSPFRGWISNFEFRIKFFSRSPIAICSAALRSLRKSYGIRAPAPEGAIASAPLAVCLKAYPDTKPHPFRKL
jgi:hypothetical protein